MSPGARPSRSFVPTPLGQVHVQRWGDAWSRPVLCLHQTPRSVDEFAEVAPRLARRHGVLAVDTPGYGASERPELRPSVAAYVDAVVSVLDHLDLGAVSIVGHHTGAVLALELAARFPRRVDRLVASGPPFLDDETRATLRGVFTQWRVRADGSHLTAKWERFMAWTGDPTLAQRVLVDVLRAGERSEDGHLAVLDYPMPERLPLVVAPTLLVLGADDPFMDERQQSALEGLLPVSRTVVLPGGVFLPSQVPGAFAETVLAWLAEEP